MFKALLILQFLICISSAKAQSTARKVLQNFFILMNSTVKVKIGERIFINNPSSWDPFGNAKFKAVYEKSNYGWIRFESRFGGYECFVDNLYLQIKGSDTVYCAVVSTIKKEKEFLIELEGAIMHSEIELEKDPYITKLDVFKFYLKQKSELEEKDAFIYSNSFLTYFDDLNEFQKKRAFETAKTICDSLKKSDSKDKFLLYRMLSFDSYDFSKKGFKVKLAAGYRYMFNYNLRGQDAYIKFPDGLEEIFIPYDGKSAEKLINEIEREELNRVFFIIRELKFKDTKWEETNSISSKPVFPGAFVVNFSITSIKVFLDASCKKLIYSSSF